MPDRVLDRVVAARRVPEDRPPLDAEVVAQFLEVRDQYEVDRLVGNGCVRRTVLRDV
ncbi:hypothetical protein [Kribbella sp. NPDC050470]|uniref:hypothetical protein n=1 Tax=unclassified Kribbella TaxID=2644121 RepID=UPI00378903CE